MTGREKIEAALSPDGTPEFGAVICYQSLFLRDHWEEATEAPWWYQFDADPARAAQPWLDMARCTGQDWFLLRPGHPRETQQALRTEATDAGVFQVNSVTGERTELHRPPAGGVVAPPASDETYPAYGVHDPEAMDQLLDTMLGPADAPLPDEGCFDLPRLQLAELGAEKAALSHVAGPWWHCHSLWGFSDLMLRMVEEPEVVHRACHRFLQYNLRQVRQHAAAGVRVVWIEDCMNDMISPRQYRTFSWEYVRPLVEAIREAGMLSVHYYCGRPDDRWDLLLDTGADALSLEESKKTFDIDIMAVAERVDGRMALLGNLDAIGVLEQGSDAALQAEVARQLAAGRRNKNRFVASLGSPVTPGTPLARVRRFTDLGHGMSGGG